MSNQQLITVAMFLLATYGTVVAGDTKPCSPSKVPLAQERDVYGEDGRIIDVTHRITPEMPKFGIESGVGTVVRLVERLVDGDLANVGEINSLGTHTGTHVDSPGHFCQDYYENGYTVGSLNLDTLNDEVMKSLNIPKGTRRVLFRTLNTDRKLMSITKFDSSYTGFTTSGAKWLVENTDIKLVGIDYLSVSIVDDAASVHRTFLKGRDIIPVEGMNLDNVEAGEYDVHCLPLRLIGADGTPSRCIVIKPQVKMAVI
ncbi:Cyclase-like protein 1 [Linum perenne]